MIKEILIYEYYANKAGDHEVHREDCRHLPNKENQLYLGAQNNCQEAVNKARILYPDADGCYWCCRPCHTA